MYYPTNLALWSNRIPSTMIIVSLTHESLVYGSTHTHDPTDLEHTWSEALMLINSYWLTALTNQNTSCSFISFFCFVLDERLVVCNWLWMSTGQRMQPWASCLCVVDTFLENWEEVKVVTRVTHVKHCYCLYWQPSNQRYSSAKDVPGYAIYILILDVTQEKTHRKCTFAFDDPKPSFRW